MKLMEILKAQGIGEDVIESILTEMKANKIYTTAEENIDIRYGKLKNDHEDANRKLTDATGRIAELEKAAKGHGELAKKNAALETQVAQLTEALEKTRLDAEIRVELLAADCLDVDYAAFKLREKGELALDENGKIKGWDDKLAGLKVQLPSQFKSPDTRKIIENKLPESEAGNAVTKEAFDKMDYSDRLKLYKENPEAYKELSNT